MVARCYIGPRPPRHDVDHKDGSRSHNHVDNLEYVTRPENLRRAREHGRASKEGTKNPAAKLTEADVVQIRRRVDAGESNLVVAKAFGVSDALVCKIKKRVIWTHI